MDKNTLLNNMPNYYRTSKVVDNLNNSNAIELNNFSNKLDSIVNQFFINTADYTLEKWEKEFGITVNNNYDINYRRSIILSKKRGQGTITVKLIENVAESFENGEVNVVEDNSNYSFKITFIGTKGVPPNLNDLKNAIEDIKPAHLNVLYEFTYNTWNYVKTLTWAKALNNTWETLKVR